MYLKSAMPTYSINLAKRTERKDSITSQFYGKSEFDLTIVNATEHDIGAIGLWQTIVSIVKRAKRLRQKYILICEDDHVFTNAYSLKKLEYLVYQANKKNLDVVLGGVSWFQTALQIEGGLFWLDTFNGCQFTIIFDSLYDEILNADFNTEDNADLKLAKLSQKIAVSFPFISIQKDFGYSDIYYKERHQGQIFHMFKNSENSLAQLASVAEYYEISYK